MRNLALDSLDEFLSKVENRAFKMALIATGQEQDALDIVQDSMLQLAQKYAHKPEMEWPPLFHRILQSKIRDWYRRQQVRNKWRTFFNNDDENIDLIEHAIDINVRESTESLHQSRAIESLENALHLLPLRQQQAFLLRAWEGLDVSETATAMQCSQGSVKTHYFRAIKALKKLLEDYQ